MRKQGSRRVRLSYFLAARSVLDIWTLTSCRPADRPSCPASRARRRAEGRRCSTRPAFGLAGAPPAAPSAARPLANERRRGRVGASTRRPSCERLWLQRAWQAAAGLAHTSARNLLLHEESPAGPGVVVHVSAAAVGCERARKRRRARRGWSYHRRSGHRRWRHQRTQSVAVRRVRPAKAAVGTCFRTVGNKQARLSTERGEPAGPFVTTAWYG